MWRCILPCNHLIRFVTVFFLSRYHFHTHHRLAISTCKAFAWECCLKKYKAHCDYVFRKPNSRKRQDQYVKINAGHSKSQETSKYSIMFWKTCCTVRIVEYPAFSLICTSPNIICDFNMNTYFNLIEDSQSRRQPRSTTADVFHNFHWYNHLARVSTIVSVFCKLHLRAHKPSKSFLATPF